MDASAILALLNSEPGKEKVIDSLPGAAISSVNFSEVVAKLNEGGMPEEAVRFALGDIGLDICHFDVELAYRAGVLRTKTRKLGLSFGDRACLALGQQLEMPVLTADRNWRDLDIGVEIRVIR